MNVAFITNYEKTKYFHRVAVELEARGHRVSWIAPSHHWATWLLAQGVAPDAILDLSTHGPKWRKEPLDDADRTALARLEDQAGLRFNDVALMDRILRDKPRELALKYFAVTAPEISRFLKDHDITVVFGEQTFGVELVTAMVCAAENRQLLVPHTIRVPGGRMAFFRGHLQAQLVSFREVTQPMRAEAASFLDEFRRSRPRPEYFHRYNHAPAPKAAWIGKLMKHARLQVTDRFDETHFSPLWLVRKRTGEVLNAFAHRVTHPYWIPPQPPERPFVLFPLHRQPEASIDVLGSRTSNQIELVRALARTIPATHDLYVKEHPNGLGDRTPRQLRELRDIPGVKLVDPAVSSFALVDHADLIVTLSGTTAYEAALLRRPAVAIADMFFGPILAANAFNPYVDSIAGVLKAPRLAGDDELVEFLANAIAQSFPGAIDNPLFAPGILDDANMRGVSAGFLELLDRGRDRWS